MSESTRDYVRFPSLESASFNNEDDLISRLEAAVLNQDVLEFQMLVNEISWSSQSASVVVKAIHMALELEAPLVARNLAEQGVNYYPRHPEIVKAARILAVPTVTSTSLPSKIDVRANNLWIDANREEYRQKWVALQNGTLLASAQTFSDLREKIGEIKGKGILITQVT